MKYTKKEIENIVNEVSEKVISKTYEELVKKIKIEINGKSSNDALVDTLAILYVTTQENTKQLIIETFNKLINE